MKWPKKKKKKEKKKKYCWGFSGGPVVRTLLLLIRERVQTLNQSSIPGWVPQAT